MDQRLQRQQSKISNQTNNNNNNNNNSSFGWIIPNTFCWKILNEDEKLQYKQLFLKGQIIQVQEQIQQVQVKIFQNDQLQDLKFNQLMPANESLDENQKNDMVNFAILNEAEIVDNVQQKYAKNQIFTYIGPTLMIINPYQHLPNLFDQQQIQSIIKVQQKIQFQYSDTEPHIYALTAMSAHCLQKNKKKQAIVISGESGAGKTENAKFAMKFLAALSSQQTQNKNNKDHDSVEEKILSCNPILEAFGNAKTVRNDNSSRFGKYVQIQIDEATNQIKGASINKYLLEKSRIVSVSQNERNYHIFYHFINGFDQQNLKKYFINGKANAYYYLNQSQCVSVESLNDKTCLENIQEAFKQQKFSKEQLDAIWRIISAILLIGNCEFTDKDFDENDQPCKIKVQQVINQVGDLLLCSAQSLITSLTYKTREVQKQIIQTPIKLSDIYSNRDALSKALYDQLFQWLVEKLNQNIKFKDQSKQSKNSKDFLSIGLLDIFGFENFESNNFEQFCINYTNEHLQQLYIAYIFKNEKLIFQEDGLGDYISLIQYNDNQNIIDVFDQQQGLFALLNEYCQLQSKTDQNLLQKVKEIFKENDKIEFQRFQASYFIITHTQSRVTYSIEGFIQKNKDELSKELQKCISESKNIQIVEIFECTTDLSKNQSNSSQMNQISATLSNQNNQKFLGAKFKNQMQDLMKELNSCDVHFVRCIKPNELKQKQNFDCQYVLLQITYLGILESIKVRKASYSVRYFYHQFFKNYKICELKYQKMSQQEQQKQLQQNDIKDLCKYLIEKLVPGINENQLLFGKKKIYFKQEIEQIIDKQKFQIIREIMSSVVTKLAACWKRKVQRRKYLQKRQAITNLNQSLYVKLFSIKIYMYQSIKEKAEKVFSFQKGFNLTIKNFNNCYKRNTTELYKIFSQIIAETKKQKLLQQQQQQQLQQQTFVTDEEEQKIMSSNNNYNQKKNGNIALSNLKENSLIANYNAENKLKNEIQSDMNKQENYQKNNSNQNQNAKSQYQSQYSSEYEVDENNFVSTANEIYADYSNYQTQSHSIPLILKKGVWKPEDVQIHCQLMKEHIKKGIITKLYLNDQLTQIKINPPKIDAYTQHTPKILLLMDQKFISEEQEESKVSLSRETNFDLNTHASNELKQELLEFNFEQFFQDYLKSRSKFLQGKKSVKQILTCKKEMIKGGSLLLLNKTEGKKSLDIFKTLLLIMEEAEKSNNKMVSFVSRINVIITESWHTTDIFKDEIITQFIKQTNGLDTPSSFFALLQAISNYLYCFAPSSNFLLALIYHLNSLIRENKFNFDQHIISYTRYTLSMAVRVRERFKLNQQKRINLPHPNFQIVALQWNRCLWVPVFFQSGNYYLLSIDYYETIADMKRRILQEVEIDTQRIPELFFGIFEIVSSKVKLHQSLISDTSNVWQILSRWERQRSFYPENPDIFIFMLRIRMEYAFDLQNDSLSVGIYFCQTYYDLYLNNLQPQREDFIKIYAILRKILNFDKSVSIEDIMPDVSVYDGAKTIIQEIEDEYNKHVNENNPFNLKIKILQICQKYDNYMGMYFKALSHDLDKQDNTISKQNVQLILKPTKIMIYFIQNRQMKVYNYYQLIKYGYPDQKQYQSNLQQSEEEKNDYFQKQYQSRNFNIDQAYRYQAFYDQEQQQITYLDLHFEQAKYLFQAPLEVIDQILGYISIILQSFYDIQQY